MKFLLILIILLSGCGARKVNKSSSKQLDNLKTEQSLKTEASISATTVDQTKTTRAAIDRTKVFENETTIVMADEAEFDTKTGKMNLKGNVKIDQNRAKETNNDKQALKATDNDIKRITEAKAKTDSKAKSDAKKLAEESSKKIEAEGSVFSKLWFYLLLVIVGLAAYKFVRLWK